MDAEIAPIGERLRNRRKALKLTLQEVGDRAGFSVGFISQIERGITVPSLTSLVAVCRVLGIEIGAFLGQPKSASAVTRHNESPVFALGGPPGRAVTFQRMSAAFPGATLRSVLLCEPPGYRSEPSRHEGEEIFFIVSGSLTIEIDGRPTVLKSGDTAHFPSSLTHVVWNHTTEPTTVFHTCTMDVFGDEVTAVPPHPDAGETSKPFKSDS